DLLALKDVLTKICDSDGKSPSMTANFVMANADLDRMRAEGFERFHWIGIDRGFPRPWTDRLASIYRELILAGVFEPALHGFTHFNPTTLMECLRENSDRGERARLLATHGVPYLASWTPEYNFALVQRGTRETFVETDAQQEWVSTGIKLFVAMFGTSP